MNKMRSSTPVCLILLALCRVSQAQPASQANDSVWGGTGELGYADTSGNSNSQNVNAKLQLKQENEYWRNQLYLSALRNSNNHDTSANRYEGGLSVGYKLDARSYVVNTLRYDHDQFATNLWQASYAIGYGYVALKNRRNELSFEIGPGFQRYEQIRTTNDNGRARTMYPPKNQAILRALINYSYRFSNNAALEETFLTESGAKQYYQNDLALNIALTKKFGLKVNYEVRYNSNVSSNQTRHMDRQLTTNLAYNFK